jgi:Glutaredoxin-like domain (DUF836)
MSEPDTKPPSHGSHTVVLYGRGGCHLCDEALVVLQRVREELPFLLLERDITLDEPTHRAYFERIPVIVLDGEELFDYFIDETVLRERLAAPVTNSAGVDVAPRVESGQ